MRRKILFMALAVTLAAAASAQGASVVLPYLNSDTFSTTLVAVNPTDIPLTLDGFWDATGFGAPAPVLAPHSVFRATDYPKVGGGVYTLAIPDGVYAYSEVRYPNGMRVRYNPLPALLSGGAPLTIYDVLTDGTDYRSYLYFVAPQGGVFSVRSYAADGALLQTDAYLLYEGTPQIVPVIAGATRLVLSSGIGVGGVFPSGPVYALSLVSHQPEGQVIVTYPVGYHLTGEQ